MTPTSKLTRIEAELFTMWDFLPQIILATSSDGRILRANHGAELLLGWLKLELEGNLWQAFVHPEDIETSALSARTLLPGQTLKNFHNRWRHREGHYVEIAWYAHCVASVHARTYSIGVPSLPSLHSELSA